MANAGTAVRIAIAGQYTAGPAFGQAQGDLRRLAQGGAGAFRAVGASFLNLRNVVAGGIVGAAVARITAEGDAIQEQSRRLAVTAREYQVLAHAMTLAGGTAGDLIPAFRGMSSIVTDAGEEGKRARAALDGLGVSLADLGGKSPYQQFLMLVGAVGRVGDANRQAALAQDVFGRSAMALLPMIRETRGELGALAESMARKRLFLSDADVARADAFRDSLAELNRAVSVAAFEALGQTIAGLTGKIEELVSSGKLAEWGAEAAAAVNAVAKVLGRTAEFVVEHKAAVVGLATAYAGLRIVQGATVTLAALQTVLAGLSARHAAAAMAANAHAAAEARVGSAASVAAVQKWADSVGKISPALASAAMQNGTFAASIRDVGGALNAVAAAGAVAFVGWNLGKVIGEVTGLHEALKNSLFGFWVDDSVEKTDEAKRNAARLAAIESGQEKPKAKPPPKVTRVANIHGAARPGEKAEGPDEQAQREWEALRKTVEGVWTAARVGQETGDQAAVALWERVSGQRQASATLAAADIAQIGARLQAVFRGDADAAVQILKASADAEVKAIADSAERVKQAQEEAAEAMGRLREMDLQDMRDATEEKIGLAQRAAEAEARAMGEMADRIERSADGARDRIRDAWDSLVAGEEALPTPDERRAAKDRERTEARLERRAMAVIARMREGQDTTAEGRAIAKAYVDRQRLQRMDREAKEARQRSDVAETRGERLGARGAELRRDWAAQDRARERQKQEGIVRTGEQAGMEASPTAGGPEAPRTPRSRQPAPGAAEAGGKAAEPAAPAPPAVPRREQEDREERPRPRTAAEIAAGQGAAMGRRKADGSAGGGMGPEPGLSGVPSADEIALYWRGKMSPRTPAETAGARPRSGELPLPREAWPGLPAPALPPAPAMPAPATPAAAPGRGEMQGLLAALLAQAVRQTDMQGRLARAEGVY